MFYQLTLCTLQIVFMIMIIMKAANALVSVRMLVCVCDSLQGNTQL